MEWISNWSNYCKKVDFHPGTHRWLQPALEGESMAGTGGSLGIECHYTAEDGAWVQEW